MKPIYESDEIERKSISNKSEEEFKWESQRTESKNKSIDNVGFDWESQKSKSKSNKFNSNNVGFDWDSVVNSKKSQKKDEQIGPTMDPNIKDPSDESVQSKKRALSVSYEKVDNLNFENNFTKEDEKSNDDSLLLFNSSKKNNLKDMSTYNVYFFLQMEYCDGLPLNLYLEQNKDSGLPRKTIFSFFKQILSGVNHIHKNNVIHRDLK
jgi:hypothetical protein